MMKCRIYMLLLAVLLSVGISAQTQSRRQLEDKMHKAESLYKNKEYSSALNSFLYVVENTSDTEKDSKLYINSRISAARCYLELDSCKSAMETSEELISSKLSRAQKKDVYKIYSSAGLLYGRSLLEKGIPDYIKIKQIFEKVMPYAEGETLDEIKKAYQIAHIGEAAIYFANTEIDKAVSTLKKAITIYDDEQNELLIYNGLAAIYDVVEDYENMLVYYSCAEKLAYKLEDNDILYSSLVGKRKVYKAINDMENVTRIGQTLDSLMAVTDNYDILKSYNDEMGNEFLSLGNYSIAESYFKRSKDLISENKKDDAECFYLESPYFLNMRDLKFKQHDYKSAIEYGMQYSDIMQKRFGKTAPYYFSCLFNSSIYAEMGDSVNFERITSAVRDEIGSIHDLYYKSLVYKYCGAGYSKLGDSQKALAYYSKADSVLAEKFDETDDMRMNLLMHRFSEYRKMGHPVEAARDCKHYVELITQVYGTESKQYADAVYFYANCEKEKGNLDYSADLYKKSMDIKKQILRKQLRYVTLKDRTSYINTLTEQMWKISSFALDYSSVSDEFVKDSYNTILTLKSLLFESDRSMYNTLQKRGTPDDVADFMTLMRLRNRQSTLYKDYKNNKDEIDANYIKISEIDNRLTEKSKVYADYTSFLDFKYEDVCSQLDENDVLFDFFDYKENGSHKYVAYIVKKGNENPIITEMFDEAQLDSLLGGMSIDEVYTENKSDAFLNLLWKNLEKYAVQGADVYYVPSGVMYQISPESLILSDGSLLGDHYNFVRLSSARELACSKKHLSGEKTAVLYGGLNYDMSVEDMIKESSLYKDRQLYVMRGVAQGTNSFMYLPQTLYETETVSDILSSAGYKVKMYTKNEGTEESFLSMHNNSPQILHIATHGFYYTPELASSSVMLKGSSDAMLLSGLVLSGGNAAWQGRKLPSGVLGGVISAGNISCLDLSNTGLVVLSSCQSGAGKITREGLYGLQRAFKKAGVQTLIMTLWNVSDVVTCEFMIEFYKNLFKGENGCSDKFKAFIDAKNTIRAKYPEPLYWAGFVMVD